MDFATTGYETLLSGTVASSFQTLVTNRSTYHTDIVLTQESLSCILNQMQAVQAFYQRYGYSGDSTFNKNYLQLKQDVNTLDYFVIEMSSNPFIKYSYTAPVSLNNGLPSLNYQLCAASVFGSNEAGLWNDISLNSVQIGMNLSPNTSASGFIDSTNQITNATNSSTAIPLSALPILTTVILEGGDYVDSIRVGYETLSGSVQYIHGGSGGSYSPALNLATSEFIVSINGMAGDYINQMTLTTSFRQTLSWPTAPNSTAAFSWTTPENATLVGFQGSCGKYLNQIAPIYLQFYPASWSAL